MDCALQFMTPSKLYLEYSYPHQKPFYHQTWFLVTLAAGSVVIITLLVAVLCVKSKSYKYKRKSKHFRRKMFELIKCLVYF